MSSPGDYSFLDRLLHRIAFAWPGLQVVLADLENDLFGKRLRGVDTGPEVFVTALARAGTTLLLSLLYATGEFATFTYRQMPFVLAPLLWRKVSRPFLRSAVVQERAHGDGMTVSFDSPEAFEEVVWLAHLRKKYVLTDRLRPLAVADTGREFETAFRTAIAKCVLLEREARPDDRARRYLSKNNANLARLPLLRQLCPGARIVIPFRHPLAHIASVQVQHERFLATHRADAFARQYMRWLGHFEFGADFRPIDFDGWLGTGPAPGRPDPDFWLRYWTAGYAHALAARDDHVHLVDFDGLLADGAAVLGRLAGLLHLDDPGPLIAGAVALRSPTTEPHRGEGCTPDVLRQALAVYDRLRAVAV